MKSFMYFAVYVVRDPKTQDVLARGDFDGVLNMRNPSGFGECMRSLRNQIQQSLPANLQSAQFLIESFSMTPWD